jgi:hypothetical protein
MFERFVFTNPGGAAMNWIIALHDVQGMQKSIAGRKDSDKSNEVEIINGPQMAKLTAWWNGKPYERRLERPISSPDGRDAAQFEKSGALTPYVERRINLTLNRFRAYFGRLGYSLKSGPIEVRFSEDKDELNAYYEMGQNRMTIGWKLAKDNDAVLHEYSHHVMEELKGKRGLALAGLQYRLPGYFTCSFKGDPELGVNIVSLQRKAGQAAHDSKPYLRTMDNRNQFENQLDPFEEAEVWGGGILGTSRSHRPR